MKLVSFEAKDFRSIAKTPRLAIDPKLTCLLGPNNEGKSNLLRGFAVAMQVLESARRPAITLRSTPRTGTKNYAFRIPFLSKTLFDWKKDFPVSRQEGNSDGMSSFIVEFELSKAEIRDFENAVGTKLNGLLRVELNIGREAAFFRVLKQGRVANTLSRMAPQIAQFIGKRLQFHYIPAIRTSDQALKVVDQIVEDELRTLEKDTKYQAAMSEIARLQEPLLDRISNNLQQSLHAFLPDVSSVTVRLSESRRYQAFRRSVELLIDDGVPTELAAKGDGVQSLAAISLLRHALASTAKGRSLVLAIEEPESHIHPGAMHRLREVIDDISKTHQVLLTTHSPVFVQRQATNANILVERQKAKPAKSLEEIRKRLGVRVSDNLRNSECALLVEGEDDRIALTELLKSRSQSCREALEKNRLGIDTLGGGTNLSYQLANLRLSVCNVHVFMDDDDTGRDAIAQAVDQGLITLANVTMTTCDGMKNSEFEDLVNQSVYEAAFQKKYGEVLTSKYYKQHKDKWSARLKNAFVKLGKPWNKFIEMEAKNTVALAVEAAPAGAIQRRRENILDSLVTALEAMLES